MNEFSNKVLRTFYLPPRVYEQLKALAFARKMSFNDLFEECLILGMMIEDIAP